MMKRIRMDTPVRTTIYWRSRPFPNTLTNTKVSGEQNPIFAIFVTHHYQDLFVEWHITLETVWTRLVNTDVISFMYMQSIPINADISDVTNAFSIPLSDKAEWWNNRLELERAVLSRSKRLPGNYRSCVWKQNMNSKQPKYFFYNM